MLSSRGVRLGSYNHSADHYRKILAESQPGSTVVLLFALDNDDKNVPEEYADLLPLPWHEIEATLKRGGTVELIGRSRGRRIVVLGAPTVAQLVKLIQKTESLSLNSSDVSTTVAKPPFQAPLRSGVFVELLGLSENPSRDSPWWRPDGSPLAERPYDWLGASVAPEPGKRPCEVAVRLHNVPAGAVNAIWQFEPRCDSMSATNPSLRGSYVKDIYGVAMCAPVASRTVAVRLGLAAGPWQTIAGSQGQGGDVLGGDVVFAPSVEKDGSATISVAHRFADRDARVVAVGLDGKERIAAETQSGGGGKLCQITSTFLKMPLKDVQDISLSNPALRVGRVPQRFALRGAKDRRAGGFALLGLLRDYETRWDAGEDLQLSDNRHRNGAGRRLGDRRPAERFQQKDVACTPGAKRFRPKRFRQAEDTAHRLGRDCPGCENRDELPNPAWRPAVHRGGAQNEVSR